MAPIGRLAAAVVLLAGLQGGHGLAYADVPTADHIAACNRDAQAGVRDGTVSATSRDEAEAQAARQAAGRADGGPLVTQSADPQIHGMEREGAQDAAYRAAYRVCMRRSGF